MKLPMNESAADRVIRVVVGLALLLVGYFRTTGILMVVLMVLGVVSLITAATGFCGVYRLLGISTNKSPKGGSGAKPPEEPKK